MSAKAKATAFSGRAHRPDAEKLITAYEHDCKIQGLTNSTIRSCGYILRNFARFLEGQGVHILDVGRDDIRAWIEEFKINRGRTTVTTKNNLTSITGFYEYLVFEDLVSTNPIPSVRKRYMKSYKEGNESHSHKIISVEEMSELIRSAVDIRDRAFMLLMAKTGVRRGELIAMDVNDVNFEDQSILLKPTLIWTVTYNAFLRKWTRTLSHRSSAPNIDLKGTK